MGDNVFLLRQVVFFLLIIVCFVNTIAVPLLKAEDNSTQTASEVANQLNSNWFSSTESMTRSLYNPLTQKGIDLYTLDKTKHGNAYIQCTSGNQEALQIMVQPSATKDLSFIQIRR